MCKQLIIATIAFLAVGCGQKQLPAADQLFNSALFFDQQIEVLTKENSKLIKVLTFGEQTDSVYLENLNWEKELEAFTAIDLRKPAYAGRFTMDSSSTQGQHVLHYHRIDSATNLSDVWIHKTNSSITQVVYLMKEQNQLYESEKRLAFTPGVGFEISGNQSVEFNGSFSYKVKGYFVNATSNR